MSSSISILALASLLALVTWPITTTSLAIEYCSSQNTGSSFTANYSIYQSNGLCETTCDPDYAFGILLDKNCWCSNYAPASSTTTNVSKCDDECPGYPSDHCGNAAKTLYAYIAMSSHEPSGTATVSATSTSTTSSTSETSKTTTSETTTSTESQTIAVETVAGEVKTVTIDNSSPTSTSSSSSSSSKSSSNNSGLSGGDIAGIVVGVFAKRRSRGTHGSDYDPSGTVMFGGRRHSKGSQMSFMKATYGDNHSHSLSAGSSIGPGRPGIFTDNRMKTDTVLYPNGRRDSSVSLQDNEDYSRPVLRLTNPD
ncbi:hypothetical protein ASPZODRAFT_1581737 [Penicilliopsis zonata CBS 506.65]|uniref:WSC domain-containing protein n=1 Tax=Penicilliopsis zonata CBS 506.65 TaxID=1073090 RepID=A0A1L9SMP9_9EURO|nr:hypothetical protein ASPZODRAFT_1581737 [Penicilliopsis zonata CBS 506.65]OJJ48386.1 hypothetical protein ASPZODRAFT_1581737 [Penicilliopsis zonata CBS 506.65]